MASRKYNNTSGRRAVKSLNNRSSTRRPAAARRPKRKINKPLVIIILVAIIITLILISRAVILDRRVADPDEIKAESTEIQPDTKPSEKPATKIIKDRSKNQPTPIFSSSKLELPLYHADAVIITHPVGRYTVSYNNADRQPQWVAYTLTSSDLKRNAKRRYKFTPDPYVLDNGLYTAYNSDYAKSGYDKGHLLPSADRSASQEANDATFYLSNVAPQHPSLNRKVWRLLEEQIRRLTDYYDTLYIVTGSVIESKHTTIGANKVSVPTKFYKTLLGKSKGQWVSIGFVMPNSADVGGEFWDYAVSVDSVERLSGVDMFHRLPDEIEPQVEADFSEKPWR